MRARVLLLYEQMFGWVKAKKALKSNRIGMNPTFLDLKTKRSEEGWWFLNWIDKWVPSVSANLNAWRFSVESAFRFWKLYMSVSFFVVFCLLEFWMRSQSKSIWHGDEWATEISKITFVGSWPFAVDGGRPRKFSLVGPCWAGLGNIHSQLDL